MKTIIIALVYVMVAKVAFAQQDLLSFDEHNKYIYYQVVDMPGMSADSLHSRGLNLLKTSYPNIKLKPTYSINNITGQGKFLTYGGVSVLKHEKGEIAYQLNVEFKDQKYRYWLTGFVFTPYQRDRYGNFVPQQGIEVPLENAISKFDKKDVDAYLNETGAFCKQFGDKLKQFIINTPKKEEITKKVVTDKW
jgi:hypothetical protein